MWERERANAKDSDENGSQPDEKLERRHLPERVRASRRDDEVRHSVNDDSRESGVRDVVWCREKQQTSKGQKLVTDWFEKERKPTESSCQGV
jgi:hypothetical protein